MNGAGSGAEAAPAELPGLTASVDSVSPEPEASTPPDRPFAYRYDITISNGSPEPVEIRGRKWVVTDSEGKKLVVEGDGVVGQTPRLECGDSFSYHSYHLVATTSVAEGAYFAVTGSGRRVYCKIPAFRLEVPA